VIATNTTISREGLKSDNKAEMGGLSGKPWQNVLQRWSDFIRKVIKHFRSSSGGIHSAEDAIEN
jgi:dihydroorotate dehydrogenase